MLKQRLNINNLFKTRKAFKACAFFNICLLITCFISCTKQVDFDLQNSNPEYGVNSLFSPDKPIELFVFKTSGVTDTSSYSFVDDAKVELLKNGELLWSGSNSESGKYLIPINPEPDDEYKITVVSEGIPLTANDAVPSGIIILSATYLFPVYEDINGSKFGKVALSFKDIPGTKNYYEIVILDRDSSVNQTFNVNSPVIILDNENSPNPPSSILFTDELFEGEKLDLDIFVSTYDDPIIVLRNLSQNYYKYRESISNHFYNQNSQRDDVYNLFKGDPIELYSNVLNGIGIFAAFSQDVKTCKRIEN